MTYFVERWCTGIITSPILSILTWRSPRPTVCTHPSQKINIHRERRKQICFKETHIEHNRKPQESGFCAEASYVENTVICLLVPKMHKADLKRDFSNCMSKVHFIKGEFWLAQGLADRLSVTETAYDLQKSSTEIKRRGKETEMWGYTIREITAVTEH